MENIAGKKALVTGGARGLGKATAIALAKEGVHVAITGRREEQLKLTVKELQDLGVTATYAVFDISDLTSVQQGIEQLNHSFGKFDIVINNAGIASFGSLLDMDADMWTSIIQTNVLGSYYVTKAILPQLIEKNEGDIIFVSSTAGLNGAATTSAYSASKFAVIGMADSLMREVRKHNIRVCTLMPSTIASDMSKELGLTDGNPESVLQPEDFAELIIANLKLPRRAMLKSASLWSTNPS
ncbi:putative oxidoreductase YoxD [Sphingobacterium faecium NBRC 15299]|jgi:3-oxoacyl-[acyl-carrier protein] reductase|uniref:3-ketoacyl-ACP reductase n=1 Tax=Sphingobacterium faecium TaxID=34087 RepID=UPI000D373597|nr:3-ketoacyl-ACP reductase [Sphingobacterium faecium]MQP28018.1 3-ketoacyl-ACP reductase [Sphingobacterium faecium]PTX09542.1 3-oxoacyl-[acyl-carrier protein] reductase [Sphingobacterium faecium]GEM63838.1 putative oxidoreductase YoxD [Sphingobacterium faecium NBRC 15299]